MRRRFGLFVTLGLSPCDPAPLQPTDSEVMKWTATFENKHSPNGLPKLTQLAPTSLQEQWPTAHSRIRLL